jgi:hypothetical protein
MHVNMHVSKHACYMHVFTCMSDFTGIQIIAKKLILWISRPKKLRLVFQILDLPRDSVYIIQL